MRQEFLLVVAYDLTASNANGSNLFYCNVVYLSIKYVSSIDQYETATLFQAVSIHSKTDNVGIIVTTFLRRRPFLKCFKTKLKILKGSVVLTQKSFLCQHTQGISFTN